MVGVRTPDAGAVSGVHGTLSTHASWTSMPEFFKQNGYLSVSSGKIFHTEEGGAGNADPMLNGTGMPPNEDPRSWSDGMSMAKVNDVANMFGCAMPGGEIMPGACQTVYEFVTNLHI